MLKDACTDLTPSPGWELEGGRTTQHPLKTSTKERQVLLTCQSNQLPSLGKMAGHVNPLLGHWSCWQQLMCLFR